MIYSDYLSFDPDAYGMVPNVNVPRPPATEVILCHLDRSFVVLADPDIFVDRGCQERFHLPLK